MKAQTRCAPWRYRLRTSLFILAVGLGIFTVTTWAGANGRSAVAYNRENLIRLHVIAESDRPEDQKVKLLVRDRMLRESEKWLLGVESREEALNRLKKNKEHILAAVLDELRQNGKSYGAHIEFGVFPFPDRDYSFGRLPAGDYTAMRVILGSGSGRNWWCVLFPPLCFVSEEQTASVAAATSKSDPGEAVLRWQLLERLLAKKDLVMDEFWQGWGQFFINHEQ